ncbi:5532_t:CDS:2, partial [Ambispora gerdemannii]
TTQAFRLTWDKHEYEQRARARARREQQLEEEEEQRCKGLKPGYYLSIIWITLMEKNVSIRESLFDVDLAFYYVLAIDQRALGLTMKVERSTLDQVQNDWFV